MARKRIFSESPNLVPGMSVMRNAEDSRKLDRASSLEESGRSTSRLSELSEEHTRPRNAGRSSGFSSNATNTRSLENERNHVGGTLDASESRIEDQLRYPCGRLNLSFENV